MRIIAVEIFKFSIPLNKPLRVHSEKLTVREGLLIKMQDETGVAGYGEASPLPGLQNESLDQACAQVLKIVKEYFPILAQDSLPPFLLFQSLEHFSLFPAVRFSLESALLDILSQKQKRSPSHLMYTRTLSRIPVNCLLSGDREEVLAEAMQRLEAGYRTFKLKVGRHDLEQEIETVRKLRRIVGPTSSIRLDANKAWRLDQALHFVRQVGSKGVEYIEEPLQQPQELENFSVHSDIPVALDESLSFFEHLPDFAGVVVLKPLLLGGLLRTYHLIKVAKKKKIRAVISSGFETGLGLRMLAHLAAFTEEPSAMGLDTWRWFTTDLIDPRFCAHGGFVDMKQLAKPPKINTAILEPL